MALTDFKRMTAQWLRAFAMPAADWDAGETTGSSALEYDSTWHGDHWQNLLSSPMDARRYVVEEWTVAPMRPLDLQTPNVEEATDAA